MSTPFFAPVQDGVTEVEQLMRSQAGNDHHPDLRAALEHLLVAGGKRVRPTIVFLIGNMLAAPHEKLVTLGAAVEMLHTATLVHDDLIDGSLLRRGIPTLNARWSPAATVLTGDFLFGRAAKLAAEADYLPLMKLFAETLTVIVNGELTQMFAAKGIIERKNYYSRIYAKTASLFEMSALSAAMIGTEDEQIRAAMKTYGYEIGMAFQIVDDVLDFTGEQATIGKPVGSDLLNGLVTLPAIYYAESHPDDPEVKLLAEGGWGNTEKMEKLVASIQSSNAVRHAMDEATEHVEKALEAIKPFHTSTEYPALMGLARYIVDRTF
ncbi:MAG: polyprenyl synthetase family protein [Chloroflexi bacterium]|nr:polyprenyl synthetase family protein [Chloroflexota bacterium]